MISELKKLNFSFTQETCDVSTALLMIKEAKNEFLAELRTIENIAQRCEASDRRAEETIRLAEKLSAERQANLRNVCSRPDPLHWQEFEGSCYYFSDTEEQWRNARKFCAAANSHLIIINSKREQDFVVPKIKQTTVWLGLSDIETEGTWCWVDGSLQGLKYWKHGEPNNTGNNEDCAVLSTERNWNDIPCDREVHFVCERIGCIPH
ncbi:hepatic lectin-like [Sceloporus undulatus]|uniref:hepatic lectin-like n=1 Tax=Sceloporus undulatus TaxID=8520 RepID=UPI001C4D21C8|nr:hepatic lectin-like [Sceloporus undulatus]